MLLDSESPPQDIILGTETSSLVEVGSLGDSSSKSTQSSRIDFVVSGEDIEESTFACSVWTQ